MSDIERKAAAFDWLSQFEYFEVQFDLLGLIDPEKPDNNNLQLVIPVGGRKARFSGNNLLDCVENARGHAEKIAHKWLAAAIKVDQGQQ